MADRREYFETFIEAGDFLKKRHPNNAKLQGVDVESLGIQWHTAEPDALVVTEATVRRFRTSRKKGLTHSKRWAICRTAAAS